MLRSLTTLLLGTLCLGTTAFSANYPIDVLYNITGKEEPVDHDAWRGAELAAEELKTQRIPVSLMLYDGQSRAGMQHAITSMRSKQHSSPIMIGLTHSNTLCRIVSPLTQAKNIFINTDSASEETQRTLGDHYFMTAATLEQQANKGAQFLYTQLKKKRAVIIASSRPNDQTLAQHFQTRFTNYGGITQHMALPDASSKHENARLLAHLKNQLPNTDEAVVYLAVPAKQAAVLISSMRSQGIKAAVMLASPLPAQHVRLFKGTHVAPLYYTSHVFVGSNEPSAELQHFKQAYQKRYNKSATQEAALGYDAVMLVGYAISHSSSYTEAALTKALKNIKHASMVTGHITLSSNEPVDHVAVLGLSNELTEFDASNVKVKA